MTAATIARSRLLQGRAVPKKPDKPTVLLPISVDIGGTVYRGKREVIGARRFDQVVYFEDLRDTDFRGYSQKEWRAMEAAAQRLLVSLVQEVARRERDAQVESRV